MACVTATNMPIDVSNHLKRLRFGNCGVLFLRVYEFPKRKYTMNLKLIRFCSFVHKASTNIIMTVGLRSDILHAVSFGDDLRGEVLVQPRSSRTR